MMMLKNQYGLVVLALVGLTATAFSPMASNMQQQQQRAPYSSMALNEQKEDGGGFFGAIGGFFEELDAFVDDATSRRLGAGSAFYGKRKSSFYGNTDKNKKSDKDMPDPTEDYQGPSKSGYFQWMQDEETGEMKPVTRMKGKNIERNPGYWDKVYDKEEKKK